MDVKAINGMTARWVASIPDSTYTAGTALSGVCVWPLLAILGGTAEAGLETITWLSETRGLSAAIGLWHSASAAIPASWRTLPDHIVATLSGDSAIDRAAVDAWAAEHTGGLIPTMPLAITPETAFLLASALTIKTTWRDEFTESGDMLTRTTSRPAIIEVTDDITCVRVEGTNGIDVELVIGEEDVPAGIVLEYAIGVLDGSIASRSGNELGKGHIGPGLTVTRESRLAPHPVCHLHVPAFDVSATHDLREFDGVMPLDGFDQATQQIVAQFSAEGFRAAALTGAVEMSWTQPKDDELHRVLVFDLNFDRSFGFLARHRATGLILAAGWIAI